MTHHHVNAIEIKKSSRYELSPVRVFLFNTPLHSHLSSVITGSLVVCLMEYSCLVATRLKAFVLTPARSFSLTTERGKRSVSV